MICLKYVISQTIKFYAPILQGILLTIESHGKIARKV